MGPATFVVYSGELCSTRCNEFFYEKGSLWMKKGSGVQVAGRSIDRSVGGMWAEFWGVVKICLRYYCGVKNE